MIGRRTVLGAIGGGGLLASVAARAGSASIAEPKPAQARMRTFMLMRGALDDRLVIGSLNGRYWGCVNGAMTPLFDVVSATFSRYRRLADGSYRGVSIEQAYFVDRETGEWLRSFDNPYTGKTVKVPTGGYPPTSVVFGTDLVMRVAKPLPGMTLTHSMSPLMTQGDNVMMTEVTSVGAVGKPPSYHGIVGLHARAGEIDRAGAKKVRCETSYTSVSRWPMWLEMSDHPGETVAAGQGSYGTTLDDLPKTWVAAARQHRPELLSDPARLLEPLWREG